MLRSAVRARLGSLYVFGGFSFFILFCTLASVFYGFLFWHSLCVIKAMLEIWRVKSDSKCRKDPEQEHCVTLTSSSIHPYIAHNCICDECLGSTQRDIYQARSAWYRGASICSTNPIKFRIEKG